MNRKSAIIALATTLCIALSACGDKGKKEAEAAPEAKPAPMEIIKEAPVAAAPAPAPASAPEAEKNLSILPKRL